VAVKIRLKRLGKIRSPHYRIVVADSRTKRDGRAIEEIGKYHPKNDPSVIEVDSERAQYWLSVGAQPSEAVVALLKRTGDWQLFSGDTSPSGVQAQKEKVNKLDVFNAALAEAGSEPRGAAVTGNRAALERLFETSVSGSADQWSLALVPRDLRLRGQVASVRVSGRQALVREVQVLLADGDRSTMSIEPVPARPRP
jgi:small subunit ribosomal protein S16